MTIQHQPTWPGQARPGGQAVLVDGVAAVDSLHPQGDILAILPAAIQLESSPGSPGEMMQKLLRK